MTVTAHAAAEPGRRGGGLTATARVVATPDGRGGTALPVLEGAGPFALRRVGGRGTAVHHTQPIGGPHQPHAAPGASEAHVALVGAMSAPLGGDRLRLTAAVEEAAALRVTSTAATIALPGRDGAPATYDTVLSVGDGARLRWLPEPLISAHGSDLTMTTRVDLAPTARLVLREEQVLGRAGEPPGRLTTRLTVHRAGRPLLDQELAYGPGAPGWDGAAVLGGHRAVGQLLVVDPALADRPPRPVLLGETAVLTPLAGPALLVTAVAGDALRLRRLLDDASELTAW
ncbi:urease accessory protein UreD [Streptomyces sp. XD-27]|uniref:urease accessory protein UreD n=1 Tax=Streptomyces sp. XD-27 TaxID=3062779 RepID=UPI0026F47E51|nr:urease accessory protein UreD [Streptomyces sp. XD-27]WKX73929.1 urease accessory protein UreD [Streptomyces sp. XD-27]